MSKRKKAPKFIPGDVVYRLWESGVKTLGIITDDYRFEALESYEDEGKVTVGETYGLGSFEYELVKQETPGEAAEKQWGNVHRTGVLGFIEGANWQAQRMYSEEEVIKFLQMYRCDLSVGVTPNIGDTTKQWFEKFKKK